MSQVKVLFYLPLRDNDGRDLASEIEQVENELYLYLNGWTFQEYVRGVYEMPDGTRSLDESVAYVVITEEQNIDLIEQILGQFKSKTSQDAIYLEIQRDIDIRFI